MNATQSLSRFFCAIAASLTLLLCSGCITISTKVYENSVRYEPIHSPVQIDASASIEVVSALAPEMHAKWKHWMNNDQTIANYLSAVAGSIRNDLTTSGLFARVETNPSAKVDYLVKAASEESSVPDYRVQITLAVTETATGKQVSSHKRYHSFGTSMFNYKMKEKLPDLVAALKADVAADLLAIAQQKQEQAAKAEAELFTKANLSDLLVSSEKNVSLTRARNRALIAAKTQQLPDILRNWKTAELTALAVKIEQTILDLNHECEVAKDRAQQAASDGATDSNDNRSPERRGTTATTTPATGIDELRDLSISYRERIELLKPILASLKEEIANRNR